MVHKLRAKLANCRSRQRRGVCRRFARSSPTCGYSRTSWVTRQPRWRSRPVRTYRSQGEDHQLGPTAADRPHRVPAPTTPPVDGCSFTHQSSRPPGDQWLPGPRLLFHPPVDRPPGDQWLPGPRLLFHPPVEPASWRPVASWTSMGGSSHLSLWCVNPSVAAGDPIAQSVWA
jgi:hypothetical protein